jgi:hypothetical protein
MGGTSRNHKKERNVDWPQGRPYLRRIPKIPPWQPLVYVKGVSKDELDGGHGTLSNEDK